MNDRAIGNKATKQPEVPLPPGPVGGPAAWYGKDMHRTRDWVMELSHADRGEIDAAIKVFRASGTGLEEIHPGSFPLPSLQARLAAVAEQLLDGRGFVLIRGVPVERYSREEAAIAYMGLCSYLGKPRSQNAAGHLLGHVKDLGVDVTDPRVRYYQTNRKLQYHTDSVDVVGLLCLKTAKSGGESFIVSSITCHNEILRRRPDLHPLLFQPFPTDRRGEIPEGMLPWFDMPVFHWHAGKLSAILTREYIESAQKNFPEVRRLTAAEREALDLLDQLTNDPEIHLSMEFRPGDIQLLHNHQILHSRGDFENWPEPERHRHLLRLWICPPNGRPLPPAFAVRYGSTTPGDRGGIVVKGTKFHAPLNP